MKGKTPPDAHPSHLPACHAVEEVLLGSDASQEAARDKAAGPQREVIGCEGGQGPAAAHQWGPTTLQLDLSQQAGDLLAVGLHTHTHTHISQVIFIFQVLGQVNQVIFVLQVLGTSQVISIFQVLGQVNQVIFVLQVLGTSQVISIFQVLGQVNQVIFVLQVLGQVRSSPSFKS